MDTIFHDLRVSVRALLNRPGFTAVAVATLALGLGATTALFSVVYGVLLRPLPYADSERIVSVWQTPRNNPGRNPDGTRVAHEFRRLEGRVGQLRIGRALFRRDLHRQRANDAEVVPGGIVSAEFFDVFGANPSRAARSRGRGLANGPRVAIVSYGFWQERLGGRANVIGSSVELSSRAYEIVGVAPGGLQLPARRPDLDADSGDDATCGRGCVYLNGVARLKPGVSPASARLEMQAIAARLEKAYPAANTNTTVGLVTLQDEIVGDVRPALLMLLGAVGVVLLIACANVANLLLVRGAAPPGRNRHPHGARRRPRRFAGPLAESLRPRRRGRRRRLLTAWWGVDALEAAGARDDSASGRRALRIC